MDLSILIPEYNHVCSQLVSDLQVQCERCGIEYEILVLDDGSTCKDSTEKNRGINNLARCTFIERPENKGRAFTRNELVNRSQGKNLLFIDSDAMVPAEKFISAYMDFAEKEAVVFGGILHDRKHCGKESTLRYRYEKWAEPHFTAANRQKHPYQQLRSFNFMMPASVANRIPFDEGIRLYGYEDVLFGKQLERWHIPVIHIDNPLYNTDIEDNKTFLKKTEEALETLKQMQEKIGNDSTLLKLHSALRKYHLSSFIGILFRAFSPILRWNLTGSHPSVFLFQCYKIGYFSAITH